MEPGARAAIEAQTDFTFYSDNWVEMKLDKNSNLAATPSLSEMSVAFKLNSKHSIVTGQKDYELTDHLGSVAVVVTDRKLAVDQDNNGTIDYYTAEVVYAVDRYPMGGPMPGRSFNLGSYRFGHNGQESDAEISGSWGNHYTAEYWMMDSRILRRWEPDPVVKHQVGMQVLLQLKLELH